MKFPTFRSPLATILGRSVVNSRPVLQSSFKFPKFEAKVRSNFRSASSYNAARHYKHIQWGKLIRPGLFTVAFCIGTTVLVPPLFNYTPLAIFKKYPSLMIYTIIGINAAVCLAWRSPQASRYLQRYGLIVKEGLRSYWSMLGAAFSHQSPTHLLVNMFVLHSFGSSLIAMIGVSNFVVMYLNSAVVASFVSLLVPVIMRSSLAVGSLGASGAIFSVFGTFAYLIPKAPIALFFIPVPGGAWWVFLGSIAFNIGGIVLRKGSHDYAAHIGGCVAGLGYGLYYSRIRERILRQRRRAVYF